MDTETFVKFISQGPTPEPRLAAILGPVKKISK